MLQVADARSTTQRLPVPARCVLSCRRLKRISCWRPVRALLIFQAGSSSKIVWASDSSAHQQPVDEQAIDQNKSATSFMTLCQLLMRIVHALVLPEKRFCAGKAGSAEVPQEVASDAALESVAHLLDNIPRDLCAHAAFHCGAHARALQYYETFVRTKQRGAANQAARRGLPDPYTDEQVTFLQVRSLNIKGRTWPIIVMSLHMTVTT